MPQELLIVEGERGTLVNESDWSEPPVWFYPKDSLKIIDIAAVVDSSIREQYDKADRLILENFYNAVKHDDQPICAMADAIKSLAAVEASRKSCEESREVRI